MSHWGCHSFQCQGPLCLFSVPTVHHQCLPWSHQQHALMTWLWSWNLINFVALVNSDLHASFSFLKQDTVVCIFSVSQNPMYEMVGLLLAILEGGCTFPLLWQSTQSEAIKEVFTFHSCFENIIYQLGERVMEKNGSRPGSRSVRQLILSPPQSGMNAAAQLAFHFFQIYSVRYPHSPVVDAIYISVDLLYLFKFSGNILRVTPISHIYTHIYIPYLYHSMYYQVDNEYLSAHGRNFKKQPTRPSGQ